MTGVRSSVDVGALSSAVQRPGIDPRYWIRTARVTALGYDSENGLFADVTMQPTGETETCLVGTPYAGNQFGAWFPLEVDDEVLVAIPDGDTDNGPVIIARNWRRADPPSSDFGEGGAPVQHVVLRAKPGKKIRILASDANADIEIVTPDATVKFQAGDQSFVRGDAQKEAFDTFFGTDAFLAWIEAVRLGVVAGGGTLDNTDIIAAITTLRQGLSNALSSKIKGE